MFKANALRALVRVAKLWVLNAQVAFVKFWIAFLPVSLDPMQLLMALIAAAVVHSVRALRRLMSRPKPIKVVARGRGAANPTQEVMRT